MILLMFGVGMHFSFRDLLAVRCIAVPGRAGADPPRHGLGFALAWFWGRPFGAALVLGLALSIASTVVLLRALEARDVLNSAEGHIAVGWLIIEDLVTVLAVIMLGKAVVALLIVLAFRYPLRTALTIAAGLAQIGEFSFVLGALGAGLAGLKLLPPEAQSLILAGALLSITLIPFLFRLMTWCWRRAAAA